jgi:hypothetical protein
VLAVIPEIVLVSRGGGSVAWKLWYFLRMLRLFRAMRLAKAVWGFALSCGPGEQRALAEVLACTEERLGIRCPGSALRSLSDRFKRLAARPAVHALSCPAGRSKLLFELTSAGLYAICVLWALAVLVNLLGW